MAQQLAFRDGIMDRIRMRETRFHEHAYLFVLSALEFCQIDLSTVQTNIVVFTLVELQLLISQATDTRADFVEIFDFESAFERDYPWHGAFQA